MPPHPTATPPEGVEYKRTDAISPHRVLSFSDLLHDGYAVAAAAAAAGGGGGGGCKLIQSAGQCVHLKAHRLEGQD